MQHLQTATARLEGADAEVAATDSRLKDKAERLRAKLQEEVQAARKQVLGGWRAGLCEDFPDAGKLLCRSAVPNWHAQVAGRLRSWGRRPELLCCQRHRPGPLACAGRGGAATSQGAA